MESSDLDRRVLFWMNFIYLLSLFEKLTFSDKTCSYSLFHFILDLSQRVDAVKDENTKLKSENQVRLNISFFLLKGYHTGDDFKIAFY